MRHISNANCAEVTKDRPGQPAYEIFSVDRRFQQSKSRLPTFKKACARKHQRERLFKMRAFSRSNYSSGERPVSPPGVCEWTNENYYVQCQLL